MNQIPMDLDELIEEHKHLLQVLRRPDHSTDKKEVKKQTKELAGYQKISEEKEAKKRALNKVRGK
jgi:hypothetical protein